MAMSSTGYSSDFLFESERLLLRPFALEDAEGMFALNNAPDVLDFTGDAPFESIAAARAFIADYDPYTATGYGRWSVLLKATNEYVGWCGLRLDAATGLTDLGYRFLPSHRNKGYATEAGAACLDYGFNTLKLARIIGRVVPANVPSIRVLEKLGMRLAGNTDCEGKDALLYEILHPASPILK